MNNAYKHAAARNVSVIVERRGDDVIAIVEDEGVGFASQRPEAGDRPQPKIGIAGMRERAALVGGELTVESTSDSGTTVRVRIPFPAPSAR